MLSTIRNIFITGSTGFLASHLLRTFLKGKENRIFALIRAKDNKSFLQRKRVLIDRAFSKSRGRKDKRIYVMRGDISKGGLGLNKKELNKLKDTINVVYHCAAICDFSYSLSTIRKVNVKGTENLLKLALEWQREGHLEKVNHISTAYIAGKYKGIFYEKDTDRAQKFNNPYEQSKFEAELVVEKYRKKGLRVDIYRPSVIVDSLQADATVVSRILKALEIFMLSPSEKIPADMDTTINIIPVDTVSRAIILISTTKDIPANRNYHIVNPKSVKFGLLLNTVSKTLGFRMPEAVPAKRFRMGELNIVQRKIIESFVPYLNQKLSFDMHNAASVLKKYDFKIPYMSKKAVLEAVKQYRSSGRVA